MKRILLFLLLGSAFPQFILCQSDKIDSLEQVLESSIHDTARLEILSELYEYYDDKDLELSLALANQFLATAEKANAKEKLCMGYIYQGTVYRKMNVSVDTVLQKFAKALACCESNSDARCQGEALLNLGGVYHRNGFPVEAMTSFQQAYEVFEELKDTVKVIASLANMGLVLHRRLDFKKSLNYSQKALGLAEQVGHSLYIGMISNNIANVYTNLEVNDTALVLYEKALAIKREIGSELSLVTTLANIGGIHIEEGRYEQAQIYLNEAYTISNKQKYPYGLSLSLLYMSNSALNQGKYEQAIQMSREGLTYLKANGAVKFARDFHEVMSESYEKLSMPDSALTHLKTARVINDSMFQSEKERQIQQLEISYQVKQKEVENKLLKTEQSFTEQQLKTRTYLSIGLIIALFLACGWGVALYRNNRAKRRMNTLLEAQVEERTKDLQVANEHLKQANYELKSFNHIASHDLKEPIRNVGNYVGLIHKRLSQAAKKELQDYFDIIRQSTNQLYTLIEDIANYSQLSRDYSNGKTEVDLEAVISSIEIGLESFIKTNNGQVIYQDLPSINSNSSLIFVALKNLVENGLKFNQSSLPTVEIKYQSNSSHHQICVADNGIGIDPKFHDHVFDMFKQLHNKDQYKGSGIGLATVRMAIERLGGSIEVNSQLGTGSRFTILLPKL